MPGAPGPRVLSVPPGHLSAGANTPGREAFGSLQIKELGLLISKSSNSKTMIQGSENCVIICKFSPSRWSKQLKHRFKQLAATTVNSEDSESE